MGSLPVDDQNVFVTIDAQNKAKRLSRHKFEVKTKHIQYQLPTIIHIGFAQDLLRAQTNQFLIVRPEISSQLTPGHIRLLHSGMLSIIFLAACLPRPGCLHEKMHPDTTILSRPTAGRHDVVQSTPQLWACALHQESCGDNIVIKGRFASSCLPISLAFRFDHELRKIGLVHSARSRHKFELQYASDPSSPTYACLRPRSRLENLIPRMD
jgi:hypothetical protein